MNLDNITINEWIDITINPPDYENRVLLLFKKGVVIGYRKSTDRYGHHYKIENESPYWSDQVHPTHWQPLPAPPRP